MKQEQIQIQTQIPKEKKIDPLQTIVGKEVKKVQGPWEGDNEQDEVKITFTDGTILWVVAGSDSVPGCWPNINIYTKVVGVEPKG